MRKLASIAGAAFLALTSVALPTNAYAASVSGSCSPGNANYSYNDINSDMFGPSNHGVPAIFVKIDYSGVEAPTTLGVIIRRNGELEDQIGSINLQTASSSSGTKYTFITGVGGPQGVNVVSEGGMPVAFTGPGPEVQGFANSTMATFAGRSDNGSVSMKGKASSGTSGVTVLRGDLQNSGTQAQIFPGDYVFYVYTGSLGDVWNVKDGTVSRNAFIADEKGYLGSFSCGVSTDQGSGPG
jgi:hypothetical protein